MKQYSYKTSGTCSRQIDIEINDDKTIGNVAFTGGCHGNLQGISAIIRGMKIDDVVERFEGIRCGAKPTSCPDQLACALRQISAETE